MYVGTRFSRARPRACVRACVRPGRAVAVVCALRGCLLPPPSHVAASHGERPDWFSAAAALTAVAWGQPAPPAPAWVSCHGLLRASPPMCLAALTCSYLVCAVPGLHPFELAALLAVAAFASTDSLSLACARDESALVLPRAVHLASLYTGALPVVARMLDDAGCTAGCVGAPAFSDLSGRMWLLFGDGVVFARLYGEAWVQFGQPLLPVCDPGPLLGFTYPPGDTVVADTDGVHGGGGGGNGDAVPPPSLTPLFEGQAWRSWSTEDWVRVVPRVGDPRLEVGAWGVPLPANLVRAVLGRRATNVHAQLFASSWCTVTGVGLPVPDMTVAGALKRAPVGTGPRV